MQIHSIEKNSYTFESNHHPLPPILIHEERRTICIMHGAKEGLDAALVERIAQIALEGLPDKTDESTEFYLLSCYAASNHSHLKRLSVLSSLKVFASDHAIGRLEAPFWETGDGWNATWSHYVEKGQIVEIAKPIDPSLLKELLPYWFGDLGLTDISIANGVGTTPIMTNSPSAQRLPSFEALSSGYGLNIAACDQFTIIAGPSFVDIFALSGQNWAKLQRITSLNQGFGYAVAITSNANGTAWAAVVDTTSESVLLYSYSSESTPNRSWTLIQTISIVTSKIIGIDMKSSVLAIGLSTQQVLIYNHCTTPSNAPWQNLLPTITGGMGSQAFGQVISVYKNQIAIGDVNWFDRFDQLRGAAYVYQLNPSAGNYELVFTASGTSSTGNYGICLSLGENTLVVGAPGENHSTGNAYVYRQKGSWDTFGTLNLISPSLLSKGDSFGSAAALLDNVIVISTPGKENPSSLWLFQETPTHYVGVSRITYADFPISKLGNSAGNTLALTGRYAFVGDPSFKETNPTIANNYQGQAFVTMYKEGLNTLMSNERNAALQRGIYLNGTNAIELPFPSMLFQWPMGMLFLVTPTENIGFQILCNVMEETQGFQLSTNAFGNVIFQYKNAAQDIILTSPNSLYLNQPNHISFSINGDQIFLYVNNSHISTNWTPKAAIEPTLTKIVHFTIGLGFIGTISKIGLSSEITDQGEIVNFTHLYTCDEESGLYLLDSAQGLNHARLIPDKNNNYPQRFFLPHRSSKNKNTISNSLNPLKLLPTDLVANPNSNKKTNLLSFLQTPYFSLEKSISSLPFIPQAAGPTESKYAREKRDVHVAQLAHSTILFEGGKITMYGEELAALDLHFETDIDSDQCLFSFETSTQHFNAPYLAFYYKKGYPNNFFIESRSKGNINALVTLTPLNFTWDDQSPDKDLFTPSFQPYRLLCNFVVNESGAIKGLTGWLNTAPWSVTLPIPFTATGEESVINFGTSTYAMIRSWPGSISHIRCYRDIQTPENYFDSMHLSPDGSALTCAFPVHSSDTSSFIPDNIHNRYVLTTSRHSYPKNLREPSDLSNTPKQIKKLKVNSTASNLGQVTLLQFCGWDEIPRATGALQLLSLPSQAKLFTYDPSQFFNRGQQITVPGTLPATTELTGADNSIYRLIYQHPQLVKGLGRESFTYTYSDGIIRTAIISYEIPIISTLNNLSIHSGDSSTNLSSLNLNSTLFLNSLSTNSVDSWDSCTDINCILRIHSGTDWSIFSGNNIVPFNTLFSNKTLDSLVLSSRSILPYSLTLQPALGFQSPSGERYFTAIPTYLDTASGALCHILGGDATLLSPTLSLILGDTTLFYLAPWGSSGTFTATINSPNMRDFFTINPSALISIDSSQPLHKISYKGNLIGTFSPGPSLSLAFTTSYATPKAVGAILRAVSYYCTELSIPSPLTKTITFTLTDPGEYLPGIPFTGTSITKQLQIIPGIEYSAGPQEIKYTYDTFPVMLDTKLSLNLPIKSEMTMTAKITAGLDSPYDSIDFYSGTSFSLNGSDIFYGTIQVAKYDTANKILTLLRDTPPTLINKLAHSWGFSNKRTDLSTISTENRTATITLITFYGLTLSKDYTLSFFGIKPSTTGLSYVIGSTKNPIIDPKITSFVTEHSELTISATITSSGVNDSLSVASADNSNFKPSDSSCAHTSFSTDNTKTSISFLLNASADETIINQSMRKIAFSNNDLASDEGTRTINLRLSGSLISSTSYNLDLFLPIQLTSGGTPWLFKSHAGPTKLDPNLTALLPSSGTYTVAISFMKAYDPHDKLAFSATSMGITYDTALQQIFLNGTSVAYCSAVGQGFALTNLLSPSENIQSILRALTFSTTSLINTPRNLSLTILREVFSPSSQTIVSLSGLLLYTLPIYVGAMITSGITPTPHSNSTNLNNLTFIDSLQEYTLIKPAKATLKIGYLNQTTQVGDLLFSTLTPSTLGSNNATCSFSGTSLIYSFNTSATIQNIQEVARSLAFKTNIYPSNETPREIFYSLIDGLSYRGTITYTLPILIKQLFIPSAGVLDIISHSPPVAIAPRGEVTAVAGVLYQFTASLIPSTPADSLSLLSPFSSSGTMLIHRGISDGSIVFTRNYNLTATLDGSLVSKLWKSIAYATQDAYVSTNKKIIFTLNRFNTPMEGQSTATYSLNIRLNS